MSLLVAGIYIGAIDNTYRCGCQRDAPLCKQRDSYKYLFIKVQVRQKGQLRSIRNRDACMMYDRTSLKKRIVAGSVLQFLPYAWEKGVSLCVYDSNNLFINYASFILCGDYVTYLVTIIFGLWLRRGRINKKYQFSLKT